jgi:hypothetical protein
MEGHVGGKTFNGSERRREIVYCFIYFLSFIHVFLGRFYISLYECFPASPLFMNVASFLFEVFCVGIMIGLVFWGF